MLTKSQLHLDITASGLLLLVAGCSHSSYSDDSTSEQGMTDSLNPVITQEDSFQVNNDIGMTVRSMANTINIGEGLDSTDYNFEGVLTDGIGMPLFTDMSGMPGQWEVEVVDSTRVRIRNLDVGNLQPHKLIEYLTVNLDEGSAAIMLESEQDRGNAHILNYRYGRTYITVETRPRPIGDTGEVAPAMEITLYADTLTQRPK